MKKLVIALAFIWAITRTAIGQDAPVTEVQGTYLFAYSVHNSLGIEVGEADPALRKQLQLKEDQGLLVLSVPADSEAAKIGLQPFDILLTIDQLQISTGDQLQAALHKLTEKEVTLTLMREGKLVVLNDKLPAFETYKWAASIAPDGGSSTSFYRIGVTLKELEAPLRLHLKLAEAEGLLVSDVVSDSPASQAGLQANDILIRCNGQPITTVEALNQTIQEIQANPAKFALIRTGEPVEMEITPRQEQEQAFSVKLDDSLQEARLTPTQGLMLSPSVERLSPRLRLEGYNLIIDESAYTTQPDRFSIQLDRDSRPLQADLEELQAALDSVKSKVLQLDTAQSAEHEKQQSTKSDAIQNVLDVDQILKKHEALRGEMHDLFSQIRASNPDQEKKVDALRQQILESWREVEKLAQTGEPK